MAEEKREEPRVELSRIVTQESPAFKLPDGSVVELYDYLIWLGNQILEMRKVVG